MGGLPQMPVFVIAERVLSKCRFVPAFTAFSRNFFRCGTFVLTARAMWMDLDHIGFSIEHASHARPVITRITVSDRHTAMFFYLPSAPAT